MACIAKKQQQKQEESVRLWFGHEERDMLMRGNERKKRRLEVVLKHHRGLS